jgi:M6 family metalloprotease-like protein
MSTSRPRRLRHAVTAGLALAVLSGAAAPLVLSPATAADKPDAAAVLSAVGKKLLTVTFDELAEVTPGEDLAVTGSVAKVTQEELGLPGAGVPATFTLQLVDARGTVLADQAVEAAADGSFEAVVPAALLDRVDASTGSVDLAVRAVDASYAGFEAADAGATAVRVSSKAKGLVLHNSFVSSVGWVKPGERYPSTLTVTNPTKGTLAGGTVTVQAPKGTAFVKSSGPGSHRTSARSISWQVPSIKKGGTARLVVLSKAASTKQLPTIVWRDLSTRATLEAAGRTSTSTSHGPKVIPPAERFETARYGDRPFPVVPVQYVGRDYTADHTGEQLEEVINSKKLKGSTFNLFQEMSLGQLFPNGTVPSAGIATADFDYEPGFPLYQTDPSTLNTCTGVTFADLGDAALGTPLYPERITNGVYNLPGTTQYYGADANGSAVIGALAGVAALQQIDSGCGPTGKLVADAVVLADPEIDYSDFDTDKDGVVDFFMAVFAGCGGNGASQLGACSDAPSDLLPYDNIWPHSSSLESYFTDPETGLSGITTDDQLKDLEGRPLYWVDDSYRKMTTRKTPRKVFVRVGPYNVNPETAIDAASVISHEYGHSLGLPDYYSLGGRETYGDWNLMATDKSQNMDGYGRQELGWVVPKVLKPGKRKTVKNWKDSKQNTGVIEWRTPGGKKYTLKNGRDGIVRNSEMYVAKLPGRTLIDSAVFGTGDGASKKTAWFSGSGNDFGCATDGGARNLDISLPGAKKLPAGTTISASFKSWWDIEWDYDYGFLLTSTDGRTFTSHASENGYTTSNLDPLAGNPNQNGCQAAYDNGLTGTSGSYDAGTEALDRKTGDTPAPIFLTDSFDVSDLVGGKSPILRFSYSTDPGLARPGWFIDDLQVTATLPDGKTRTLFKSDFEKSGSPKDPQVFNGACKPDSPGACTLAWQYVKAGAEAEFDHAYYLEMRDRSGFDLDGKGQIDRDPITFEPGLSLTYTDEAHGYGNAGTDNPPAQHVLDSVPEPGNDTPNLADAAFKAGGGRSTFSDFGSGWIDNYSDPSRQAKDAEATTDWLFDYRCLSFKVLSMKGDSEGPSRSDGDLTGTVAFRLGTGCGRYDYGY